MPFKRLQFTLILILAFVLSTSGQPPQADAFYQAIRNDNLSLLRDLIKAQGANVKDATGQTPLMFATAFGSREAVRALVDSGAEINATSNAKLTALHLAWRDESVVRLLLDHGATVNAKSQLGFTPLIVAASATGTAGVVTLLLNKGADVNAAESRGVTPLIAAASVGNTAAAKLLLDGGADANAIADGQPSQKTVTPLMGAAHNGDIELTRLLLARKVDVNAISPDRDTTVRNLPVEFGGFTALHLATAASSPSVMKLLIDAGASVDAADVRGITPLAWAIASDRPDPQVVRLLLNKGANRTAASKAGEDPLAWARKFNNPAVLSQLKLAPNSAVAGGSVLRASVPSPRDAVERSLVPLLTGSEGVKTTGGGCIACHAQPMTAVVAELASRRGWHADPALAESSQVTSAMGAGIANFLQGRENGGLPDNHLYSTFMMAVIKMPPTLATDAWVYYLAAKQRQAGNWHGLTTRAPIQDGDISRTALAIQALSVYGIPARKAEFSTRIERAAAWLAAQQPQSTEERTMQLLGLNWAGTNRPLREIRIRELKKMQRPDGGWGQTPNLLSDAYATGQVLYAFHELGVPAANSEIQRGIAYLLRTQAEDGTWYVKSRAMKIQPYFESGFPYGDDQWISQSGTAWAAMALAVTGAPGPATSFAQTSGTPSQVSFVRSMDGTRIAVECTGKGPSLLFVHGGIGDRSRWKPLLPLFASDFTVCAMDRRGHGGSEAGSSYSLNKEFEDVAAVVNTLPGPVFVLGHSIGGLFALEASFLTDKISKLVLYEPPLQDLDHTAVAERMEKMIRTGDREQALVTHLREIVMISPDEIAVMKSNASWPSRVSGIDMQIREIRELGKYRFDAKRMRTLQVPTLLLTGDKTASPQLKQATSSLMETLPRRTLVVFEGEEHNAMDNIPWTFAESVTNFLHGR